VRYYEPSASPVRIINIQSAKERKIKDDLKKTQEKEKQVDRYNLQHLNEKENDLNQKYQDIKARYNNCF